MGARTLFDEIVEQDCPEGSVGTATRFCSEQHGWGEPDLFGCTSFFYLWNWQSVGKSSERIDGTEHFVGC
ncbi:Cadherin EGF LAG seven-pass G-type receptor 3 like protein [Argiope bruennichi]|uniref:Cadherin EGF LAG seven-pass G-type receptor 3 like protein n=1 Tax=Argiope bruennichi TaxID=94029 RepID=A0A8T0FPB8_ARGBR|nr:Cadherin EGF LAG seven-pass G-type receptor 3 like protein [Argiope bruennichi]